MRTRLLIFKQTPRNHLHKNYVLFARARHNHSKKQNTNQPSRFQTRQLLTTTDRSLARDTSQLPVSHVIIISSISVNIKQNQVAFYRTYIQTSKTNLTFFQQSFDVQKHIWKGRQLFSIFQQLRQIVRYTLRRCIRCVAHFVRFEGKKPYVFFANNCQQPHA